MAVDAQTYPNSFNSAIVVNDVEDDIEFIKSVTGRSDLNANNIQSALDTIYLDGRNLTDRVRAQYGDSATLENFTEIIRNALSTDNEMTVTVMHRNSIFASPRAVILGAADSPEA